MRGGNRRALAKAITLVESTRDDHRAQADQLLNALMPHTGNSIRLGISGVPGVGKSTFIETFGEYVIGQGKKVAVLAVDPTSALTGGSIMGDKTRMEELSRNPHAYIRPSPAGSTLGGVARRTRESLLLCEAAGFDLIIVETVGVGQSETAVADMTDMFLLLLLPGGGDELQGIKRGIMELADLILVNKADGDSAVVAKRTVNDYKAALGFLHHRSEYWTPQVEAISALKNIGIDTTWQRVLQHNAALSNTGVLTQRRAEQAKSWLWSELASALLDSVKRNSAIKPLLVKLEGDVLNGTVSPSVAVREILAALNNS